MSVLETGQRSASTNIGEVVDFLDAITSRLRLVRTVRLASVGIIFSCLLFLVVRLAVYFLPSPKLFFLLSFPTVLAIFLLPSLAGLFFGLTYRTDRMRLARYVDDRLRLKDRLASALTLQLSIIGPAFAENIAADAENSVRDLKASDVVPLRWQLEQTFAVLSLVLTLLAVNLPISPLSKLNSPAFLARYIAIQAGNSATSRRASPDFQPTRIAANQASGSENSKKSKGEVQSAQSKRTEAINRAGSALDKVTGQSKQSANRPGQVKPQNGAAKQGLNAGNPGSSKAAPSSKQTPSGDQSPTLGDKLRQFADKLSQRPLTSGEMQQAAQSVDQVNHKLDGLQMTQTQEKLSESSQDLNNGSQARAIADIRAAAYLADHEGAVAPQGASAGQGGAPGKDTVSVSVRNSGSGAGTGQGSGSPTANNSGGPTNHGQSGGGYGGGTQQPHFGAPRQIDPSKLGPTVALPPIALPVSNQAGRTSEAPGDLGNAKKLDQQSTVPYVPGQNYKYQMSEEHAVTGEQTPPAYRDIVKRYFSSLPGGR